MADNRYQANIRKGLSEILNDEEAIARKSNRDGLTIMLRLLLTDGYTASVETISTEWLGNKKPSAMNAPLRNFSRRVAHGRIEPDLNKNGQPYWSGVLCNDVSTPGGPVLWQLKPEAIPVLCSLFVDYGLLDQEMMEQMPVALGHEGNPDTKLKVTGEKYAVGLALQRLGHTTFRAGVCAHWKSCAITKCNDLRLLNASHIKPFNRCSFGEHNDPCNGLLLSPNFDRVFDKGFISFDDKGAIIISPELASQTRIDFGIHEGLALDHDRYTPTHRRFMAYHRLEVYRG